MRFISRSCSYFLEKFSLPIAGAPKVITSKGEVTPSSLALAANKVLTAPPRLCPVKIKF